jgi:pilus assembly protein CpaB
VVAARDLTPGAVLGAGEVSLRELPDHLVPDGSARSATEVLGRTLAAPVRRGEPLTDVRMVGADLARAVSADPGAASVPLRLPDPDIAALLHPGAVVDVVTIGERQTQPVVLARRARVLAVLAPSTSGGRRSAEGRLVLVALDAGAATRVAAASLSQAVTVTVR